MIRTISFVALLLVFVSMAFVHFILPGMIESNFNQLVSHGAYSITEDSRRVHDQLFVADLHSDSLLWKRDLTQWANTGHMDLPRLQKGNVALQVFSATTKSPSGQNYKENTADSDNITLLTVSQLQPIDTWFSIYERASYLLGKLADLEQQSGGELKLIKTRQDLQDVIDSRETEKKIVGGIFGIEGAHPLEGEISNLDRLFKSGMRVVGLTHFFDNRLGGSLHGQSKAGLTEFGREVIKRANELELVIDVAHSSPQMVRDVLALSTRPLILSHGGIKSICDNGRNLDDELMVELAAKGGLLGVGYWQGAVCDPSPKGIVKSIRSAIEVMGEDHVSLGSDYDGATSVELDTSELSILTQTMQEEGFTETEIRKVMGENAKRFFLANLPG